MAQTAVKVTLAPAGRFTDWLMLPEPAAAQVPPPEPVQVQLALVQAAGKISITAAVGAWISH